MLFNSIDYFFFLTLIFFVHWTLVKNQKNYFLFLLFVSWFFYMSWNFWFIGLIIFSSVLDYVTGALIYKSKTKKNRKIFLMISLIGNLGVLFFFKYFNFFIDSANTLGQFLHFTLPKKNIILPVGISFYTFQTMSYTIDIFRKKLKPEKSFVKFALFVSFFPQLVAGPIVKASEFLPQLNVKRKYDIEKIYAGIFLILVGLFKKIVISDFLAVNFIDRVFSEPLMYSGVENLLAVYAYGLQIYNDFSGYSDIAIGSAMLLGFHLPLNFNSPYKAFTLRDFWRRWHISLSSWLRDYLYISLGGSKKGKIRTYFNLFVTMLLGGLWHGAGWNFVFWGFLHGTGLAVLRFFEENFKFQFRGILKIIMQGIGLIVTFHFVSFAWIFFRARSFKTAWIMIKNILQFNTSIVNVTPLIFIVLIGGYVLHYVPVQFYQWSKKVFIQTPMMFKVILIILLSLLFFNISSNVRVPFIYFQF